MKSFFYNLVFLVISVSTTHAQVIRPVTPATLVNIYNNIALDGDTLLLAAGTYSTAIAYPTGKSLTLKADPAAATQPVLTFSLGNQPGREVRSASIAW